MKHSTGTSRPSGGSRPPSVGLEAEAAPQVHAVPKEILVGRQGLEPWTLGLKARPRAESERVLTSPALRGPELACTRVHRCRPTAPDGPSPGPDGRSPEGPHRDLDASPRHLGTEPSRQNPPQASRGGKTRSLADKSRLVEVYTFLCLSISRSWNRPNVRVWGVMSSPIGEPGGLRRVRQHVRDPGARRARACRRIRTRWRDVDQRSRI